MALTKISGNVVQQNNFSLSGVVTATSFTGDLTGNVTGNVTGTATTATNLADGANITTGTISNDRLPSTITKNLTGDVTGNLTGNVTGNVTGDLTGDVTGNLTGNVSSSGANTLGSLSVTNDATVGGALTVTGNLTVNGTTTTIDTVVTAIDSLAVDGDVTAGGNLNITGVSTFGGNVDLGDDDILRFGAGQDLQIYHDSASGQSKIVETGPSVLKIQGSDLRLSNAANTADYLQANDGGAVKLFYNGGTAKFETTTNGVSVTGSITANTGGGAASLGSQLDLGDNQKARFGAGQDLQIYHNGTNNYIDNTSDLYIRVNGSETAIYATANGKVALNYDGNNRFETTLNGAKVTGDLNVTGILTVGQSSVTIDGTNNKITTPKLDYAGISSSISDTAVDVFVYDTRKDSDGGAWRKRTQHTSWYNETLNTSTRGSRREFPAVAVIVAESTQVTIYDGDDPDLPIWMVFNQATNAIIYTTITSVYMLNGKLIVGTNPNAGDYYDGGIKVFDFISEFIRGYAWSYSPYFYNLNISQRNVDTATSVASYSSSNGILVNTNVNDVAMTVLPNAPIDSATGLPVPTIAIATDGGVSVIKDDGTVVDYTHTNSTYDVTSFVEFLSDTRVAYAWDDNITPRRLYITPITSADSANADLSSYPIEATGTVGYGNNTDNKSTGNYNGNLLGSDQSVVASMSDRHIAVGDGSDGLNLINVQTETGIHNSLVAFATTSYNTGWMHGNIKGAFLSDTDATNVTGSELITNGDFSNGLTGWTVTQNGTGSVTVNGSNQVVVTSADSSTNLGEIRQSVTITRGVDYIYSFTVVSGSLYNGGLAPNNRGVGTYQFVINEPGTGTATYQIWIVPPGWLGSFTADNFSLRRAERDRSVNGGSGPANQSGSSIKGLQVYGTITKSAVATGAELVGYSFATTSDYLEQPYNSDIGGVGTGDFSVMGWFKNSPAASTWFDIASDTAPRFFVAPMYGATNDVWIYLNTSGLGAISWNPGIGGIHNVSSWQFIAVKRVGNTMSVSKNGADWINNTTAAAGGNLSGGNSVVTIGQNYTHGASAHTGQLALWRFSQSAPSAEQIKKIYEDEKVLFQENAKCTLYGSSDAVTALAYDDSTNLLYAGTSSGRSDFQGLRRINNTTTAVTTAMSASNGLVAEQ